ncbi:hypothetical protein H9P43_008295 [Blastocladiella emersonii ATCC 22665]|nr:hypothetical protein H9P43_008295 [Blastocladiella emersonii ATCC 22665]
MLSRPTPDDAPAGSTTTAPGSQRRAPPTKGPGSPRSRTVTLEDPSLYHPANRADLHARALAYAHVAGGGTDPGNHPGARFRHNPFCDAADGAAVTAALTLDFVLSSPPRSSALRTGAAVADPTATGSLLARVVDRVVEAHPVHASSAAAEPTHDHSVYTGTAGVAWLLFKLHRVDPGSMVAGTRSTLSLAEEYAQIAATRALYFVRHHPPHAPVGVLGSPVGALAIGAAVAHHVRPAEVRAYGGERDPPAPPAFLTASAPDPSASSTSFHGHPVRRQSGSAGSGEGASDAQVGALVDAMAEHVRLHAFSVSEPSEILYGRAGLLYALWWLAAQLPDTDPAGPGATLHALLPEVVEAVIEDGRRTARTLGVTNRVPLVWMWHDKVYVGAAHGMAGILTVLMALPAPVVAPYLADIGATLEFLAAIDGYPVSLTPDELLSPVYGTRGDDDTHVVVQWCHGVVGLGHMYLQAHRTLGDAAMLARAEACGDVTWHRGITNKHVGLCHGVAGNAYLFLSLWSVTGERRWYQRALAFALVAAQWDGGHSDHPFGVWEGFGGLAWLIADLIAVTPAATRVESPPLASVAEAGGAAGGVDVARLQYPRPWVGFPCVNDVVPNGH